MSARGPKRDVVDLHVEDGKLIRVLECGHRKVVPDHLAHPHYIDRVIDGDKFQADGELFGYRWCFCRHCPGGDLTDPMEDKDG